MNLALKWREIVTQGGELELGTEIARMNRKLGTKTTHSRFGEWERLVRQPSAESAAFMISEVLTHELCDLPKTRVKKLISDINFT